MRLSPYPQERLKNLACGAEVEPCRISRFSGVNVDLAEKGQAEEGSEFSFLVTFREVSPRAFRSKLQEKQRFPACIPLVGAATANGWELVSSADHGTRFLVTFSNIPPGVRIFVSAESLDRPGSMLAGSRRLAQLVPADSSGLDCPMALHRCGHVRGVPIVELVVHGQGTHAVWECVERDESLDLHELAFGVVLAARPGEAALGTAEVSGTLAPVSVDFLASKEGPLPRFLDLSQITDAFMVGP